MELVKVRRLCREDLDDVKALYCKAFDGDKYFLEHGDCVTAEHLPSEFSDDIEFCVLDGVSFGAYQGGCLVGILMAFDYFNALKEHPIEFDKVFGIQRKWGVWPFKEEVNEPIERLGDPVMYMMAMAVSEKHRRKGIASMLLDSLLEVSPGAVASDVSAPESIPMYARRGFKCSEIEQDYILVTLEQGRRIKIK